MDERMETLVEVMTALDEQKVLAIVQDALAGGTTALDVIRACEQGLRGVGERYEQEEIFLTGLIMAGEIFRQVVTMAHPSLEQELSGSASGTVLLGTVAGDIHNIGKNLVVTALRSFGFTVTDLGVDVPPERFLAESLAVRPDIVALSGTITASYQSMRHTVDLLDDHAEELGGRVPVLIGGGTIDELVCEFVHADHWTADALQGVRICQRIVSGDLESTVRPAAGEAG